MWNRASGKAIATKEDTTSRSSRRKDDEERPKRSRSGSVVSLPSDTKSTSKNGIQPLKSNSKSSSRGDDRDRGFNPISSSYSSTTQNAYPGTASASVATALGNHNDEPYIPAGLVRNASLADQMPKSKSSRDERNGGGDEDQDLKSERRKRRAGNGKEHGEDEQRRERKGSRDKEDEYFGKQSSRPTKYRNDYRGDKRMESQRGPTDFAHQIEATGFSQFPGQYDGGMPHPSEAPADHLMSSHVQDQFPGQFPVQSTAPYRPPLAASEGGPGLAAEYYGDAGESVAEQPGNRTNTPSLIVGAEPHLQPALAIAAPPPEPSASGGVGAAASFYNGEFDESLTSSHDHQSSSTYATAQIRPTSSVHTSSTPAIPSLGGAAMGAAAGYFVGSQTSSHVQRPGHDSSVGPAHGDIISPSYQRPPSPTAESYYSHSSQPPRPLKQSSHSSNGAIYAAGAAGLAAAAYHQNHQTTSHDSSIRPQYSTTPMAQRHRHHGPLEAVVDFFRDPDGVAQFEEYSEIVGICRYCFAPGSSPRDAPRKHHYRRRRSNERLNRVDKDSRYHSSENEGRRKNEKSWLATGLAGYGLAKVGESLFKQKNDFDDTYSVKTGRHSTEERSHAPRRQSRSKDRIETGITIDGKLYRKDIQEGASNGSKVTTYESRQRSRSRSQNRTSSLADAALGGSIGTAVAASSTRHRKSASPKGAFVRTKQKREEYSPERRSNSYKKKKKKKAKGFFSLGSASSSSTSVDSGHDHHRHHSKKRPSTKSKDDRKAEAAILGLGAAAAALSLNDGRNSHKKSVKQLVGVKETREDLSQGREHNHNSEEEMWESAPDNGYESADSGLAYGAPRRRASRESLSSQSSGTDKWDWRWGSKKRKSSSTKRKSPDYTKFPSTGNTAVLGLAESTVMSPDEYQGASVDDRSHLPLQQVFPIPTSDPTRFDVGREGSVMSSGRPSVVPIQHPQPITPVSSALYSNQVPYEHSYSAPAAASTSSRLDNPSQSNVVDVRSTRADCEVPSGFVKDLPKVQGVGIEVKPRRRDSSPARFGTEAVVNRIAPRRRSSAKDDTSVVRFDRTEEQEEADRQERRRKRKEDKERRESEGRGNVDMERRSSRDKPNHSPERQSVDAWVAPAAAGVVGAAIGAVVASENSRSDEETREQRRERRRREREREEIEDEEASKRRERRRKERELERERDADQIPQSEHPTTPREVVQAHDDTEPQSQTSTRKGKSVWQEAASPKRSASHENYGDFFRPLDLSSDQVKVTSADANADIDFDQTPSIVTVVPKGFRDSGAQPVFSPADTDEKIDTSSIPFPVPRFRLVEPTPPSSRVSTPTIGPRDGTHQANEPAKDPAPSKVTWGEDQTHEYTVITPDEVTQEIIEPAPDDARCLDHSLKYEPLEDLASSVAPKKDTQDFNEVKSKSDSISYGEDVGFAATLAASAEDAGFDPSIVMNDPTYRRRDSPPSSNDRSIPGAFDNDDDSTLSKSKRKKKDRATKRSDEEITSESRDDNAIVQDNVSQVDNPDFQTKTDLLGDLNEDCKNSENSKSKKSGKGRKGSQSKDEFFEVPESIDKNRELDGDGMYKPPGEDTPSEAAIAPDGDNREGSKKPGKKSKHEKPDFDDTESGVSLSSVPSGVVDSQSNLKKGSKGSMWDRVLGRSRNDTPQENGIKESKTDTSTQDFEDPKRKGKKAKGRSSARGEPDDSHDTTKSKTTSRTSSNRRNSIESDARDTGRTTQDQSTKVHSPTSLKNSQKDDVLMSFKNQDSNSDKTSEIDPVRDIVEDVREQEHKDAERSESFLDMRPEPPPPPDIKLRESEPAHPSEVIDVPPSPHSLPEYQLHQTFEPHIPDPLSSPTAVPFDFRFSRPRPSIRSARSMSQTRLPTQSSVVQSPRPKPRPRSTEFTSSKEFWPLMLVERHSSHQDLPPEESYPSLPSSHTTSRSSSVKDPEELGKYDYEMTETNNEKLEDRLGLRIHADRPVPQPDLLDSQQATPTASSFHHSLVGLDRSPQRDSRPSSPEHVKNEGRKTSLMEGMPLGAIMGGSAALALHEVVNDGDTSTPDLPKEERDQFEQGLEEMAPDAIMDKIDLDAVIPQKEASLERDLSLPQEVIVKGEGPMQQSQDALADREEAGQINKGMILPNEIQDQRMDPAALGEDLTAKTKEKNAYEMTPKVDTTSMNKSTISDEFMDPREDFTPQKIEKDKKSKRKGSKPESPQDQADSSPVAIAMQTEDKSPVVLEPGDVQKLQEQDAQDAVDSWFSPAASSKKDKGRKRKETLTQALELGESSAKDNVDSKGSDGSQVARDLSRGLPEKTSSDLVAPGTKDPERAEQSSPQGMILPNEKYVGSQLERKQSKTKGRKSKKGTKSKLQDDGQDSILSNVNDTILGDQSSQNDTTTGVWSAPIAHEALSQNETENLEREEPGPVSGCHFSPDFIPLPFSDDLDLQDEYPLEPVTDTRAKPDNSVMRLSPEESSDLSRPRDEGRVYSHTSQDLQDHQGIADKVEHGFVHTALSEKPRAFEADPDLRGASMDAGLEEKLALPGDVANAIAPEQVHDSSLRKAEEDQKDTAITDDTWPSAISKKKQKKGKKSNKSSVTAAANSDEVGSEPAQLTAESVKAEDQSGFIPIATENEKVNTPKLPPSRGIEDLDSQDVAAGLQSESKNVENDSMYLNGKKKGKKDKTANKSFGNEMGAAINEESALPTTTNEAIGDQGVDGLEARDISNTLQEAPEKGEEEWMGFSSQKKAKKARKSKQISTDDTTQHVVADADLETPTPIPPNEALEGNGVRSIPEVPAIDVSQEESNIAEDEWASFSTKRKGKKGKKQKPKTPDLISEAFEPDAPQPSANEPQLVESQQVEPHSSRLEDVKPEIAVSKSVERELESAEPGPGLLPTMPLGENEAESDRYEVLHATTSTSQEVAKMLEAGKKEPMIDNAIPEISSGNESTELTLQKIDSNQRVLVNEEILPIDERSDQVNDLGIQELDLIHQYGDGNDPEYDSIAKEKTVDPAAERTETKELEIIDQYGTDKGPHSTSDTAASVLDTVKDSQLSGEVSNSQMPEQGKAVAINTSAAHAVLDEGAPRERVLVSEPANEMENRELREDNAFALLNSESVEQPCPDLSLGDRESDLKYSNESQVNNEEQNESSSSKDAIEKDTARMSSFVKPKTPIDHETPKEIVDESPIPEAEREEKNQKLDLTTAKGDQVDREPDMRDLKADEDTAIEPRDRGVQDESLPAESSSGLGPETNVQMGSPELSGLVQPLEIVGQEGSDMPQMKLESQPTKTKRDKKKAKKAKALSWEEQEESIPLSDQKPIEEHALESGNSEEPSVLTNDTISESKDDVKIRPKSKKDRKKAKKAHPSPWDSISPESEPTLEAERKREEGLTEQDEKGEHGSSENVAAIDEQSEPVMGNTHARDVEEKKSALAEDVALLPAQLPTKHEQTALENSGVQADVHDASFDSPIKPDYHLAESHKENSEDQVGVDAHTLALDKTAVQRESDYSPDNLIYEGTQDGPSIMPIPEDNISWTQQEQATEELEPTEVTEPGDSLLEDRDMEKGLQNKASLITPHESGQAIEARESDPASEGGTIKGKKSKKKKPLTVETNNNSSLADSSLDSIQSRDVSGDHKILFEEPTSMTSHAVEEPSSTSGAANIATAAEDMSKDKSEAPETQEVKAMKPEDELWSAPAKKSKKNKKQRKGQSKYEEQPKTVESESGVSQETPRDAPAPPLDQVFDDNREAAEAGAADLATQTSEDKVVNTPDRRESGLHFASELERQGDESPRASSIHLPISAAEAVTVASEPQEHQQQIYEETDHSRQLEPETFQSSPAGHSSRATEEAATDSHQGSQHQRERSEENDVQHVETLRELVADSSGPAAISELTLSQEPSDQSHESKETFDGESREGIQILESGLPTPSADSEMLDAQEQQEYDQEYAKELERQLRSSEETERSNSLINQEDLPSASESSIDSVIKMPLGQRMPLAKPPPLEDIVEESRSRSGSAQDSVPGQSDKTSPFQPPKQNRKGKKSKKKQQPIIWEDDIATLPPDNEMDHVRSSLPKSPLVLGSGDPRELTSLEEPIEDRPPQRGTTSPTNVPKSKSQAESSDYFTIQPSTLAEENVGLNPEHEEFRRELSSEPRYPSQDLVPGQREQPTMDVSSESQAQFPKNLSASAESTKSPNIPETAPSPANDEWNQDTSYATEKKGKKGKAKKEEVGRESNTSALDLEQSVDESSEHPESLTAKPIVDRSMSGEKSPERSSRLAGEPSKEERSPSSDDKFPDTPGLTAAAGLGVAALAAEGLARRDSKRGGKKGKKGKKTKWADFEDESPSSKNSLTNDGGMIGSAEMGKPMEQESRVIEEEQKHRVTPPQTAITTAPQEPVSVESDLGHHHQQTQSSSYRDSAINVSDSPVIPEDVPVHSSIRDSGYPETEPSPTIPIRGEHEDTLIGEEPGDSLSRESEEASKELHQRYQTPERKRSTTGEQPNISSNFDVDEDGSGPISMERNRRLKSYDSDDSADSGFDVQRRRRRQATSSTVIREPSPVSSTTKDRSSVLFNSSPSVRETVDRQHEHDASNGDDRIRQEPTWSFSRGESPKTVDAHTPGISSPPHESDPIPDPLTYGKLTGRHEQQVPSLFGGPIQHDADLTSRSQSPPDAEIHGRRQQLNSVTEESPERLSLHAKDKRDISDVGSPERGIKERRIGSPLVATNTEAYIPSEKPRSRKREFPDNGESHAMDLERSQSRNTDQASSRHGDSSHLPTIPPSQREGEHRTTSAASMRSDNSIHAIIRTPDQVQSASGQSYRSSGTPPLRRVDRSASGDLRGASRLGEAKTRAKTSEAESDSGINIPSSSTYDPVTDKGKSRADMADVYEGWGDVRGQSPMSPTRPPSMRKRQSMQLLDLETRLDQLVSENRLLQSQKSTAEKTLQDQTRDHSQQRHAYEEALQEHKTYLAQKESEIIELRGVVEEWQGKVNQFAKVNEELTSSRALNDEHDQRYRELEDEHVHLKERHTEFTTGMESLVQREVASHLEAKNSELQQLRVELESAKQQVRSLQQQLLTSRESQDFVDRDEDYFDSQCQSLCQHVQQWVLRFSKFSDMKACYRASEIRDETKIDRMENAILDGTDVDIYLQDRVKRRDVFMAVVMTMIFDYIFTRYLFGMDREQRQKLKNLEKTLQDIGPVSAVCKWRATTLTLLMKRDDFARQRATDTEAIVNEIYDTLATFLPPPSHLVAQIQDSLRKVINAAADLSIEMRTQRADYQMLPPLQPDYDTNGDLAQKVYFNSLTMNERSGTTTSNQALQEQGAVVRMVLFPLVVKNEEDDEQIIVCPAQVLTANSKGKKTVRVMSVQGSTQGGRSEASFADMSMKGGMI